MSQLNKTNYPNQIPLPVDYVGFVRDADGVVRTVTMQQLANLFATLAGLNLAVSVYSIDTVLTVEQMVVASSGSPILFTLPPSSLNPGRGYHLFNNNSGLLTLAADGADLINGAATQTLAQWGSHLVRSDGLGNWSYI